MKIKTNNPKVMGVRQECYTNLSPFPSSIGLLQPLWLNWLHRCLVVQEFTTGHQSLPALNMVESVVGLLAGGIHLLGFVVQVRLSY